MFIKREEIKYSERERGIEKINKGLFPKKKKKVKEGSTSLILGL